VRLSVKRRLLAELRRRNVFKASAAYLALGWVVVQITTTLVPALNLPSSLVPIVTWIGVIGFGRRPTTAHAAPRWLPFLRKIGYAPEQLAKIEFKVTLPDAAGNARAASP
jgi:hypothetical protein